jgi:glyoxylase-like metal-dependent hydrolase (beta-lactamase superfamily II)
VLIIPAGNASTWTGPTGNNTYLLLGQVPALIDAGVGNAEHIAAIARALEGQPLALVLITHAHADHMAGVPALVARWRGVCLRKMPPDVPPDVDVLRDGERVLAGNTALLAIATPGHSPDHCCFLEEAARDMYCGDLVRSGGTIVIPVSRGGDLADYLESLRRVRALHPNRLLAAHGPVIDQPSVLIDGYIKHRAERDIQIIRAVSQGWKTPKEIVAHVYGTLDEALTAAASESVLAHLVKLRNERRVEERDGLWRQAG